MTDPTPEQRLANALSPEELAAITASTDIRDASAISAALGGIGLGDTIHTALPGETADNKSPEGYVPDKAFGSHIKKQLASAKKVFASVNPQLCEVPTQDELAEEINLEKLEKAYRGYKAAGMSPKLVVAPRGFKAETWGNIYKELGINLDLSIEMHNWKQVLKEGREESPAIWQAAIIPSLGRRRHTGAGKISHDLTIGKELLVPQANAINMPLDEITVKTAHMNTATLLTYYAIDAVNNRPSTSHIWLEGTYWSLTDSKHYSPIAKCAQGSVSIDMKPSGAPCGQVGTLLAVHGTKI